MWVYLCLFCVCPLPTLLGSWVGWLTQRNPLATGGPHRPPHNQTPRAAGGVRHGVPCMARHGMTGPQQPPSHPTLHTALAWGCPGTPTHPGRPGGSATLHAQPPPPGPPLRLLPPAIPGLRPHASTAMRVHPQRSTAPHGRSQPAAPACMRRHAGGMHDCGPQPCRGSFCRPHSTFLPLALH